MKSSKAPMPFNVGDRVSQGYHFEGEPVGTFEGYCRGYLSHGMVRWSDDQAPKRIAIKYLRLAVEKRDDA